MQYKGSNFAFFSRVSSHASVNLLFLMLIFCVEEKKKKNSYLKK